MDVMECWELEYGVYWLHLHATVNQWKYGIWTNLNASVVGLLFTLPLFTQREWRLSFKSPTTLVFQNRPYSIFQFSLRPIIGLVWSSRHTWHFFLSIYLFIYYLFIYLSRHIFLQLANKRQCSFSIDLLRYGRFQREKGCSEQPFLKLEYGIWNMELEYGIYRLHLHATISGGKIWNMDESECKYSRPLCLHRIISECSQWPWSRAISSPK